jgi:hypothetical protein
VTFLKFSRDRRGYEHFYLVHQTIRRGGPRNRVLYWFRTPPGVKVGRAPFDDDVRRALEKQNPDVSFDWQKLLDTPIPPPAPDVERWRERRRIDREMKHAALSEVSEAAAAAPDDASEEQPLLSAVPQAAALENVASTADPDPGAVSSGRTRRRRRGGRRRRLEIAAAAVAPAEHKPPSGADVPAEPDADVADVRAEPDPT